MSEETGTIIEPPEAQPINTTYRSKNRSSLVQTPTKPTIPSLVDKELDDILFDAFVGLYGKMPNDNGLDFDFVPMEDSYDVLKGNLKTDLQNLIADKVNEALTSELNAMPNHTSVNLYVRERLAQLKEARNSSAQNKSKEDKGVKDE